MCVAGQHSFHPVLFRRSLWSSSSRLHSFLSDGAPVVSVPHITETAVCSAKVVIVFGALHKKGKRGMGVSRVYEVPRVGVELIQESPNANSTAEGVSKGRLI